MAKKQAAGRGSIVKRKDGRWMAAATINGKREYFYGRSQGEVSEKMDKALNDSRNGVYIKPTKQTFGEWLDLWLKEYAKPVTRPTTFMSYSYLIDYHVKPGLGDILLKELQPSHIQKFYNQKLNQKIADRRSEETKKKHEEKVKAGKAKEKDFKSISSRTVRYMHILISQALEQALKEGKIIRNPAKATKPPKVEKKEARYLTPEQLTEFLESISTDRWYSAFIVDLNSGMRLGELVALKWNNIEFKKTKSEEGKTIETGIIYVKEAVSRVKINGEWKLDFHPPKSKKGLRSIPLPSGAVEELKKLKKRQAAEKLLLGKAYLGDGEKHELKQDDWFVFTWEDGRMVEPNYLSKHFLKLIRKNKLSANFHSLRHSYASALLMAGTHPKVAQELLGDSTITVVLDTYSHVIPGLKERAADTLEGLFEKKKPSSANEG